MARRKSGNAKPKKQAVSSSQPEVQGSRVQATSKSVFAHHPTHAWVAVNTNRQENVVKKGVSTALSHVEVDRSYYSRMIHLADEGSGSSDKGKKDDQKFVVESSTLEAVDAVSLRSHTDMLNIPKFTEVVLLHNLRTRFREDECCTWVGDVLVSVNPYTRTVSCFSNEILDGFVKLENQVSEGNYQPPPHVFAVAQRTVLDPCDHIILVNGDSGSGKTEATKGLLKYIARSQPGANKDCLLNCNPLLESFGNAKTLRNENSSRFGKFIKVWSEREPNGEIIGATLESYLLERSRITEHAEGERGYHIFYQLAAGMLQNDMPDRSARFEPYYRKVWEKLEPQRELAKAVLCSEEWTKDLREDEHKQLGVTLRSMEAVGLSEDEAVNVLRIVLATAAVRAIHIPTPKDENDERAISIDKNQVDVAAKIMGVDTDALAKLLSKQVLTTGKSSITKDRKYRDIVKVRNSLCREMYSKLFNWLVERAVSLIVPKEIDPKKHRFVGVLDIYGFEVFDQNGFEQLCINFANERLQHFFNQEMFMREAKMYQDEGLDFKLDEHASLTPDVLELFTGSSDGFVPANVHFFIFNCCKL